MAGFFCGSLMLLLKESRSGKLYESCANSSSTRVLLAFGNLTQLQSDLRDSETVLRGQTLKRLIQKGALPWRSFCLQGVSGF